MYSTISNHLFNFSHYAFAFLLLFILFPAIIFKKNNDSILDNIVANYIRMVFIVSAAGYLLVILKIFEIMGLAVVFFALYMFRYLWNPNVMKTSERITRLNAFIFDILDGASNLKEHIKNCGEILKRSVKELIPENPFSLINKIFIMMFCILVFGYALYIRGYDAYAHAAPGMSDAYVTLAWMKYISANTLFHDGIYPMGFHIYMAVLQKFASIDCLYILKYTGPINGLFICIGIYFFVSRLSKRNVPGIIAAVIYGILIMYLPGEWERQAATNSQEFGFVFVLPTIYFFYKYIIDGEKFDLLTAFCGFAATGLIHTISFAFVAIGIVGVGIIALIENFKGCWERIRAVAFWSIISGLIALIPIVIGMLMGKGFHGSSAEFLVSQDFSIVFPTLKIVDYIALCSIPVILIGGLIKRERESKFNLLFAALFSGITFMSYYFGGVVTKSSVIATRFSDLWSLIIPVTIGTGIYTVICITKNEAAIGIVEFIISVTLITASIFYIGPKPIIPYKMEYNSNIEQYLRIRNTFRPTEWMIVSQDEGYAVVLGTGFHLMMGDFLKLFDPAEKYLVRNDTNEIVKTPDIFIYNEKRQFTTHFEENILAETYARRREEMIQLKKWVETYREIHNNITIFYEDEDIQILRIHQTFEENENFDKVWGT